MLEYWDEPSWTLDISKMKGNLGSIETKAIHAGEPRPRIAGAVVMPVFQSATYQYAGEKNYDDVRYIRLNNTPNHLALAEKLSALENAEDALVTASGMAAISTSLLTFLGKGDHFLAQDCLYGGTHDFVTRDIEKFGISYDFIDGNDPESWGRKLKPTTRAIYVETISNPLMQVPDLESVVRFANSPISREAPRHRQSQLSRLGEPPKSRASTETLRWIRWDDEFRTARRRRRCRIIHARGSVARRRSEPRRSRNVGDPTRNDITFWTICRRSSKVRNL